MKIVMRDTLSSWVPGSYNDVVVPSKYRLYFPYTSYCLKNGIVSEIRTPVIFSHSSKFCTDFDGRALVKLTTDGRLFSASIVDARPVFETCHPEYTKERTVINVFLNVRYVPDARRGSNGYGLQGHEMVIPFTWFDINRLSAVFETFGPSTLAGNVCTVVEITAVTCNKYRFGFDHKERKQSWFPGCHFCYRITSNV